MRVPELQRILIEAARRQELPRARRVRLARRPLLALVAVLVLGGSTAVAVLSVRESGPLTGTVPLGLLSPQITAGTTQYQLSVFPYLSVGWTGWCTSVNFTVHGRRQATSYGCGPVESPNPVELDSAGFGSAGGEYQYAILSDRVAEVRYADGARLRPIGGRRLPSWMRAAVRVYSSREARADGNRRFGREELLDASGHRLLEPVTSRGEAVEHLPLFTLDAAHPADLPCTIHARALAGLVTLSQTVTARVPWPRRAPGGFLVCANATYRLDGTDMAAAVLVNALDPQQPADGLPGLALDRSHPGILVGGELGTIGYPEGSSVSDGMPGGRAFESFGPHQWDLTEEHNSRDHSVSARRVGLGWLVVEGGTPSQRARLLDALHTSA
jgi:hypothetical protein